MNEISIVQSMDVGTATTNGNSQLTCHKARRLATKAARKSAPATGGFKKPRAPTLCTPRPGDLTDDEHEDLCFALLEEQTQDDDLTYRADCVTYTTKAERRLLLAAIREARLASWSTNS